MRSRTWLAILMVIFGIYYVTIGKDILARMYVYPLPYEETVLTVSEDYHVPPALVAGVILTESKFNTKAESDRGALGLMQLMPETAHWIAEKMNQPKMSDADIKTPSVNIRLGGWYLSYLLKTYNGNVVLALAAYNAGHGQVDGWIEKYHWKGNFSDIDAIPYGETREYVRAVLANSEAYGRLYPQVHQGGNE